MMDSFTKADSIPSSGLSHSGNDDFCTDERSAVMVIASMLYVQTCLNITSMNSTPSRSQRIRSDIARINIEGRQAAELTRFSLSELSNVLELKPLLPEFTSINRYKRLIDQLQQLMQNDRPIERQ